MEMFKLYIHKEDKWYPITHSGDCWQFAASESFLDSEEVIDV
jgi:hypothetical protein